MMTVGELRERLGAYPPETEVFMVTERHDLLADIREGGDPARSSVQPWLVYSNHHNRVSLYEHIALGYTNGLLQKDLLKRIGETSEELIQQLIVALARHPVAEADPEVIDAIADIEKALEES